MKTKTIIFMFACANVSFAMTVTDHNFQIDFKFTETTKCMDSQRASSVSIGNFLGQCVLDCAARSDCLALNFRRQFPLCEFFASKEGTLANNSPRTGHCVYIKRDDMTVSGAMTSCDCQDGKICDTMTKRCVTPVCPHIMIENGKVNGNTNEARSRIQYTCDANYAAENEVEDFATCQADGTWTHTPNCLKVCNEPANHPNSLISAGRITVGTIRSYTCDDAFRMSLNSTIIHTTCESNGEWTSTDFRCVADFRYLGCHEDIDNNRILDDLVFSSSEMTPHFCIEKCFSLGFIYAYTEANSWCHCGHQTSHEIRKQESECDTHCSGEKTLICGGHWRASLFVRNTDVNYLGCYKGGNLDPILDGATLIDVQMDSRLCRDFCLGYRAMYALTQCFCGNTLLKVERAADNECRMPCAGNALEFCGGLNLGSLFTTE